MGSIVRLSKTKRRLSGLAGVDLFWRVPELTPGEGAGVDIAVALVGLGLELGHLPALEAVTTWFLLGYAAVALAPNVYPRTLGLPTDEASFRLLFGVATVVVAVPLRVLRDLPVPVALFGMFVIMGMGSAVFLTYLHLVGGWTLSPEDERFVTLIDAVYPTDDIEAELREDFLRSGLLGLAGAISGWTAAGIIVVVPVLLSGIVCVILLLLYPLPDLLILGWTALSVVGYTTGRDVVVTRHDLDLETQLYDVVEEATRSTKGMTLGTYLVVTAFAFGLLFAIAVDFGATVEWWSVVTVADPRVTWNAVGFLLVVVAASCYGVWCCLRMANRLPAFLRHYRSSGEGHEPAGRPWRRRRGFSRNLRGRYRRRRDEDDEDEQPPPPRERERRARSRRPVGFIGPSLAVVILTAAVVAEAGILSTAFAVVWPLALLGLVSCLVLTRWSGTRSVRHDDHYIVWGIAAFVLAVQVLGSIDSFVAAITAAEFALDRLPFSVYMAGVVVWVGYIADVFRYADAHDDARRLLKGGYLLAFAVVFGALTLAVGEQYVGAFYVLVGVTGVGGIALFLTAWFQV